MEHSFDVEVAIKYGIAEAILLKHICFWCLKNREGQKNFHNGTYWMYYTLKDFQNKFCYLKPSKIRSALAKLEQEGLIITGNFNTEGMDRTKWYAATERAIDMCGNPQLEWTNNNAETHEENHVFSICENSQMHLRKNENGENKPVADDKPKKSKPVRHKYGEYQNVLLTDDEIEKLMEFEPNYQQWIENLSRYMGSTGKKYKSHYITIRNWIRRDREKRGDRNATVGISYTEDEINQIFAADII